MVLLTLFSGVLGAAILYLIQLLSAEKRLQAYWAKWDIKEGRNNDVYWLHIVNMNARVVTVSNIEVYGEKEMPIIEGINLKCANNSKDIDANNIIYIDPFHVYPLRIEINDKKSASDFGYKGSISEVWFLSNARGNIISKLWCKYCEKQYRIGASSKRYAYTIGGDTRLSSYRCAGK